MSCARPHRSCTLLTVSYNHVIVHVHHVMCFVMEARDGIAEKRCIDPLDSSPFQAVDCPEFTGGFGLLVSSQRIPTGVFYPLLAVFVNEMYAFGVL